MRECFDNYLNGCLLEYFAVTICTVKTQSTKNIAYDFLGLFTSFKLHW